MPDFVRRRERFLIAAVCAVPMAEERADGRLAHAAHPRRLNVLGFVSRQNTLHSFETQEKVTAQFFLECAEALLPTLPHQTVLMLDNATVHRSKLVRAKRREWKHKGLRLLFLPPHCPHLNLIETLWRLVKYCWLWPEAYQNFATFCQSVTDILAQVGTKYRLSGSIVI